MNTEGESGDVVAVKERDSSLDKKDRARDFRMDVRLLPDTIRRRIRALKSLQVKTSELEAKFFEEVHNLECRYNKNFQTLYNKRKEITQGSYEPNEDELYPEEAPDEDVDDSAIADLKQKLSQEFPANGPGIPQFWLTIFRNIPVLSEGTTGADEEILKYLEDVRVELMDKPMGFRLEFQFKPNEFFKNKILTKEYEMKCKPDEEDPFGFEGPEIVRCKGCTIEWNTGKDVTIKKVKKKQKHRSGGAVRTVTKTVPVQSFFNFFNPPTLPEDPSAELDDDVEAMVSADFELGHYFRERIIPHAVLYFTGDAEEDFSSSSESASSYSSEDSSSTSSGSESNKGSGQDGDAKIASD